MIKFKTVVLCLKLLFNYIESRVRKTFILDCHDFETTKIKNHVYLLRGKN